MMKAIKWILSVIAAVFLLAVVLAAVVGLGVFGLIGGVIVFVGVVVLLLATEIQNHFDSK